MNNIEIKKETGNRKADATQRFTSHPSLNTFHAAFEPIDNLLIYVDKFGKISYEEDFQSADFKFVNDGTSENIPTYERLKDILDMAGSTMSSKKGSSMCGMGIEVFGLESRPSNVSTVICQIEVVRDNLRYGGVLVFSGSKREISYELSAPQKYEGRNYFSIEFKGCWPMSQEEMKIWKSKIREKLYVLNKDIELKYCGEPMTKVDMLYEKDLLGTENFETKTFSYSYDGTNVEFLTVKMADIAKILKSEKANDIDKSFGKMEPEMSGVMVVYDGQTTVHRGDKSWKVIGRKKGHPTLNGIRINIECGRSIFEQMHSESQVKCETNVSIKDIKDIELRPMIFTDIKTGETFHGNDICKLIKNFCNLHKTDLPNIEKCNEFAEDIKTAPTEDLRVYAAFLKQFTDNKVKPKTIYEIISEELKKRNA